MLSKIIGSRNATVVRNKYSNVKQAADRKYNAFEAGRQRTEDMRNRFPGWEMRGSYKLNGMDSWHLKNAVNSAKRDGYKTKLVPSVNGKGEKVKVLFIQYIGRKEPVKLKRKAPKNSKDLVPKTMHLKGKVFHLVGIGSLDYAIDRKKGFQYDGYLATTRKLKDPYGEPFWAVYAYR